MHDLYIALFFIATMCVILYNVKNRDDIALKYYSDRESKNKKHKIYDISHKYLPSLHDYSRISDVITVLFTLPVISNYTMFKKFIYLFSIIFIIREVITSVTILPKHKKCDYESFKFGGCHDLIFSGHTAIVVLSTLLYRERLLINDIGFILINSINIAAILLSRYHYTVDVLVAPIVVGFVWGIFSP